MTTSQAPEDSQKVWRYMSYARFVWMLHKKQLWLSRVDLLGDPWELTLSGQQLARVLAGHPITPVGQVASETAIERAERIVKEWRRKTFINCWSASDHESHALWRIYSPSSEGVAIQTTFGKLRESLNGLPVHRVTYCEPGSQVATPQLTQLATQKRPMFAYEHEVRIVAKIDWTPNKPDANIVGHGLDWDPETAIENIYVHPEADYAFNEAVTGVVEHFAPTLKGRIWWSAMQMKPPF